MKNANAAVAGVTAIFSPVTAGYIALTGLGSVFLSRTELEGSQDSAQIIQRALWLVGIILLDEESGNQEFSEIDSSKANELGLKAEQVKSYNRDLEELNIVFEDVKSQMTEKTTPEDAAAIWEDNFEFLSPETVEVIKVLATK